MSRKSLSRSIQYAHGVRRGCQGWPRAKKRIRKNNASVAMFVDAGQGRAPFVVLFCLLFVFCCCRPHGTIGDGWMTFSDIPMSGETCISSSSSVVVSMIWCFDKGTPRGCGTNPQASLARCPSDRSSMPGIFVHQPSMCFLRPSSRDVGGAVSVRFLGVSG